MWLKNHLSPIILFFSGKVVPEFLKHVFVALSLLVLVKHLFLIFKQPAVVHHVVVQAAFEIFLFGTFLEEVVVLVLFGFVSVILSLE